MGVQPQLYIEIKNSFIHVTDDTEEVRSLRRPRSMSEFSGLRAKEEEHSRSSSIYSGSLAQDDEEDDCRTTVMMRDIPNSYCTEKLVQLFDIAGFYARYDFVYLPVDFRTDMSLGYAFVNFVSNKDAQHFIEVLDGFSSWAGPSTKVCQVSWADPNQGLSEHVERYRNSPVMHDNVPDSYKPRLYYNGVRVPFPTATKRIRPPRVRPAKRLSKAIHV